MTTLDPRGIVPDDELEQWAAFRADDAGRLARELLAYRRLDAPQPALAVIGLDTVAVAHEIAKRIATSGKTGRVHQIVYDAATEGALEALALASPPLSEEALVDALREIRQHFTVERTDDGRIAGIGHDSEALPKVIAILDAALSSAPATADGWPTMDSAPKDGTRFAAIVEGEARRRLSEAYWCKGLKEPQWVFDGWASGAKLTRWCRLPAAPTATGDAS